MNRFKNVLMVARGDYGTALERAARLARANAARLTLVDVVEDLPSPGRWILGPRRLADLSAAQRMAREVELEARAGELRSEGLEVAVEVRSGNPALEIIRRVLEHDHDLVIKPALGEGKVAFGSTGLHLMRKCPCPVWMVKGGPPAPYSRILAAVDPDPERSENAGLNRLVMDLASSLAEREGGDLHVVHAWRLYGEETLRGGVNRLSDVDVDGLLLEEGRRHQRWLDDLLAGYADHPMSVHLVHGAAQRVIPALARDRRIDLIVMGSVARTGIAGYFIGNTAESVLTEVDCSVLAVKPEGFVSPVAPTRRPQLTNATLEETR